jgi:hypothetical protein
MANLVSDLINEAFLNISGFAVGEGLTSAEQTDAFMRLNQIISSWSTEQLTVPNMTHTAFTLAAGTSNYTLGTGGTLVTSARPLRVTGASSVSGNFRSNVEVMSFEKFAATVSDPLAAATVLATKLAADGSFPSINLRVFPTPAATPGTLWLDYWMAIAQFATVGDTVALADGFELALQLALAVHLYPQYGRSGGIDPVLAANAQSAKASLVDKNLKILGQPAAPQGAAQ